MVSVCSHIYFVLLQHGIVHQQDVVSVAICFLYACSQEQKDEAQLWHDLKDLQPEEPLPHNMPDLFYTRLQMLLKCSQYADRISPFLQQFPVGK